jgi:hypothetical protein
MFGRGLTAEERQAGNLARKGNRRRRAEEAAASVDALLADADGPVPQLAQQVAARARKGNLKALVQLKCWECSCWQRTEIAHCPVTTCPLHAVRPYR